MSKKLAALSMLISALPLVASAVTSQTSIPGGGPSDLNDVKIIMCNLAFWMFTILIILAVIMAVYAAFIYLTAAGDAEKVKRANHLLIYIAVAIVVALIAKNVPTLVSTFVGGGIGTGQGCP